MPGDMTNGASGLGAKTAGRRPKLVLVACDNSEAATKCVEWALDTFNQKVHLALDTQYLPATDTTFGLVHVVPPVSISPFASAGTAGLAYESAMAVEEREMEGSTAFLREELVPLCERAGVKNARVHVIGCEDDSLSAIGAAISRFAESAGADLIVASRHSKSAISQLFLGSTTARLATSSAVPLTILP